MKPFSIIAIYMLFWVLTAFAVMPFGIRTPDESGEAKVKGQADSAPSNFRPGTIILRTTIVSAILFGLFYLNYLYGWVSAEDLNIFGRPLVAARPN